MTYLIPSIVTDVSAMFVAIITLRTPDGEDSNALGYGGNLVGVGGSVKESMRERVRGIRGVSVRGFSQMKNNK